MSKIQNVTDTKWAFYEAMENGSKESMADQFETLMHHYKRRGELIKKKDVRYWDLMKNCKIWVDRAKEDIIKKVLMVISKYPRSDNFSLDGRLVSADYVIQKELQELGQGK